MAISPQAKIDKQNELYLKKIDENKLKSKDPKFAANAAGEKKANEFKTSLSKVDDQVGMFLKLMMTQLQHQGMDPVDTDKLVQQISSFTNNEQLILLNQRVDKLSKAQEKGELYSSMSLLGNEVEAKSNKISLENGMAEFSYDVPLGTEKTEIMIQDMSGNLVRRVVGNDSQAGWHKAAWDGLDEQGSQRANGTYYIKVIAYDQDKEPSELDCHIKGTISGIDNQEAKPKLHIGENEVLFDDIVKINSPKIVPAQEWKDFAVKADSVQKAQPKITDYFKKTIN